MVSGAPTEVVFNAAGQRFSEWNGTTRAQLQGKYYLGIHPVAFYTNGSGAAAHFEHQDWLGTERMRTTYNGGVEGTFTSLPWGDAQTVASGTDLDANHYAMLDYDAETATDHAQFRQYGDTPGNWHSPDPYSGSYDSSDPQSFNRYSYALNNPVDLVDPLGLFPLLYCETTSDAGNDYPGDPSSVGVTGGGTTCYIVDDGGARGGGTSVSNGRGAGGGGGSARNSGKTYQLLNNNQSLRDCGQDAKGGFRSFVFKYEA